LCILPIVFLGLLWYTIIVRRGRDKKVSPKDFEKNLKNLLTRGTKCDIIRMSRGKAQEAEQIPMTSMVNRNCPLPFLKKVANFFKNLLTFPLKYAIINM
jgi:hypothetical protein